MTAEPQPSQVIGEISSLSRWRRVERPRTIPEQIADQLGAAILRGDYLAGERLREQEIARLYGVSRGPVREAIRSLARRGMVEFYPRRGAFAVGVSLDLIADFFNLRAVLLGLAARCFVRTAPHVGLAELNACIARLRTMTIEPHPDPVAYTLEVGRAGASLYRNCGNLHLARTLREQVHGTLWGLIWRERPLDYLTPERQQQALDAFVAIQETTHLKQEDEADRIARLLLFTSRDNALEILAAVRHEAINPVKLLQA